MKKPLIIVVIIIVIILCCCCSVGALLYTFGIRPSISEPYRFEDESSQNNLQDHVLIDTGQKDLVVVAKKHIVL